MDTEELISQLKESFGAEYREELSRLSEELKNVDAQMAALRAEDLGWLRLNGGLEDNEGLTLDNLKEWSQKLREAVTGSPLPKQANALRYSYTFSQPFIIPGTMTGTVEPVRGKKPKLPRLNEFYNNETNQRYIFGKEAQELISTACSTDSVYLALGDDTTRTLRPVPLFDITAVWCNPDFPGEVWAYLREWEAPDGKGQFVTKKAWYYTDRFTGTRATSLPTPGGSETAPVDTSKTMLDFVVNQQVGWTFGSPDLLAGHVWNRKYITMMSHGEEVSAALARFALTIKAKSQAGADKMSVKVNKPGRAGATAVLGEGNEMGVLTSSRSAYDFAGLRDIAGMYAAAAGVSVVDLLASPAASGSSYGSAQSLQPSVRRGIEARRSQIAAWMERVIVWGTGERIQITPASIEEVDPYRRAQMVNMSWNSGLVHAEEARPEFLYVAGITPKQNEAPEGVLLPNNEDSWERSDIDPKDGPAASDPTAPSPDGTGNDGGAGSTLGNDMRDDLVAS